MHILDFIPKNNFLDLPLFVYHSQHQKYICSMHDGLAKYLKVILLAENLVRTINSGHFNHLLF